MAVKKRNRRTRQTRARRTTTRFMKSLPNGFVLRRQGISVAAGFLALIMVIWLAAPSATPPAAVSAQKIADAIAAHDAATRNEAPAAPASSKDQVPTAD